MEFNCETCNYKTDLRTNLDRHNKTKKHIKLCGLCSPETGGDKGLIPEKYLPIVVLMELNQKQEIELIKSNHLKEIQAFELKLMKLEYENEIKIRDTMIQCEKEKNELMVIYLTRSPQIQEPVQRKAESKKKDPIAPIELPENIIDNIPVAPSPSPCPSPKPEKKCKCLKEFIETKCEPTEIDDFYSNLRSSFYYKDVIDIVEEGGDMYDYVVDKLKTTLSAYNKYQSPFYHTDTYHKKCYILKDGKLTKEEIEHLACLTFKEIQDELLQIGVDQGELAKLTCENISDTKPEDGYKIGDIYRSKEYYKFAILEDPPFGLRKSGYKMDPRTFRKNLTVVFESFILMNKNEFV